MLGRRPTKAPESGLDISPLIDMVFILLIFFMVSSTLKKDKQIDLNRPKAASATFSSTKSLRVSIDAQQKIYLDGKVVRIWVLQSKVRDLMKQKRSKDVLVITDKSVSAERLVEVVDQIRLAGAEDIGVATEGELGQGA